MNTYLPTDEEIQDQLDDLNPDRDGDEDVEHPDTQFSDYPEAAKNYQVIEDNAGGMFLFFFDPQDNVILGLENVECVQPGDLDSITLDEAQTWDSQIDNPQAIYNNITSFNFGWSVVADQDGVYPGRMGRAAEIVFGIDGD